GRQSRAHQRCLYEERCGAGFAWRAGSDAHALRAGHDRRGLRCAALQRGAKQNLKNRWHRRSEKVNHKDAKLDVNKDVNKDVDSNELDQPAEAKVVAADAAKADAEMAKLTAEDRKSTRLNSSHVSISY